MTAADGDGEGDHGGLEHPGKVMDESSQEFSTCLEIEIVMVPGGQTPLSYLASGASSYHTALRSPPIGSSCCQFPCLGVVSESISGRGKFFGCRESPLRGPGAQVQRIVIMSQRSVPLQVSGFSLPVSHSSPAMMLM